LRRGCRLSRHGRGRNAKVARAQPEEAVGTSSRVTFSTRSSRGAAKGVSAGLGKSAWLRRGDLGPPQRGTCRFDGYDVSCLSSRGIRITYHSGKLPPQYSYPVGISRVVDNGNFGEERSRQELQTSDVVSETQPLVRRRLSILAFCRPYSRVYAQRDRLASSDMIVGCLESVAVGLLFVDLRTDRGGRFRRQSCFVPAKVVLAGGVSMAMLCRCCMNGWKTCTVHKVELSRATLLSDELLAGQRRWDG
jgi:hypothetical protein